MVASMFLGEISRRRCAQSGKARRCVTFVAHFDAAGSSEKLQKNFKTGISLKNIEQNKRGMNGYSNVNTCGKKIVSIA